MKRAFLAAALCALPLSACAPLPSGVATAPAPLTRTTIDDIALEKAWQAFDLALDAINLLGDANVIVPGTPRGKAVAAGIRRVNRALAAAERFAAAGSATDYVTALQEVGAGLTDLRAAMKGN